MAITEQGGVSSQLVKRLQTAQITEGKTRARVFPKEQGIMLGEADLRRVPGEQFNWCRPTRPAGHGHLLPPGAAAGREPCADRKPPVDRHVGHASAKGHDTGEE